jgi:hypothetical protein
MREGSANGFAWSADSRFVAVLDQDDEDNFEVLDARDDFRSVFSAEGAENNWYYDHEWSATGSRLVLFGASEPGGECEVIEADLEVTPPQVTRRGSCPGDGTFGEVWGVLKNGAVFAFWEESDGLQSLWLLERGEQDWRPVATGLSYTHPTFTPDESFVVFDNQLSDGTVELLAYSLSEREPVAIPLQPSPAPYLAIGDFYAGGVILHGGDARDAPTSGKIWWAPLGPSSFGPAVSLADVPYASSPVLQPEP